MQDSETHHEIPWPGVKKLTVDDFSPNTRMAPSGHDRRWALRPV